MRLAFSTLGCPSWPIEKVVAEAAALGYDGVEIRGIGQDVDLRQSPDLAAGRLGETRRRFADAGIAICCLGASASFADPARRADAMQEARDYVELAAALGCPLVRVFGGTAPQGTDAASTVSEVADCLAVLSPFAQERGVRLALETHDAFSTGGQVAQVLSAARACAVGALWDLHHPYREGEPIDVTWDALRADLVHAHVKDSRDGRYCLLGEGDVPVRDMLALLAQRGDRPDMPLYLSLEWEKRWHPDLAEPEIVFPQYAARMREYLSELHDATT